MIMEVDRVSSFIFESLINTLFTYLLSNKISTTDWDELNLHKLIS